MSTAPWSRVSCEVLIFLSQHPKDLGIGGPLAVSEQWVHKLRPPSHLTAFVLRPSACKLCLRIHLHLATIDAPGSPSCDAMGLRNCCDVPEILCIDSALT
ncbi:hypothetical protein SO802_006795 [Lithocarpus litseifolius]|uniref:Uncharacterized protein n=1 Tax=Lithocarpus litseifolius TaxID=425828 RepID=A0AAW2DPH2_9ROSI